MDKEETSALAAISEMATNLPAPVEQGLFKAIGNLLGGLSAIPAAWLKRPAQAFDDVTASRSAVSAIIAKGVAEQALADPVIMQAAAEIYMPSAIRKARNKLQIAQQTVEFAAGEAAADEAAHDKAAAPDDDWMNSFVRFAEDASSEKLQTLFARILAGEVVRPGSFALSTLRTISELDQSVATDFSMVWERGVGEAVDYDGDFQRGEWFARWKRLAEAGLMASDNTAQFLPPFVPIFDGNALWSPVSAGGVTIVVHFPKDCSAKWNKIDFTRAGRQLGSLLPRPKYESNMRSIGRSLLRQGVARVELRSGAKSEVIPRE